MAGGHRRPQQGVTAKAAWAACSETWAGPLRAVGTPQKRLGCWPGAVSSVGRAPARQAGGHWFEPSTAHSLEERHDRGRRQTMNAPASITVTPVLVADLLAEGERMPVYVHVVAHPDARVLVDTGITELHSAV